MAEPQTSAIEVVFFDIGGVLLTNGWDHVSRERAAKQFALDEGFEERHHARAKLLDASKITLDQYLDEVFFERPRTFTRDDVVGFIKSESQPYPETIAVLDEVARSGKQRLLCALNNESREINDYRIAKFELDRRFDAFLSSCYLGLAKPDPAIYRRALEIVHRAPSKCIFVDDRAENVAPARELGIQVVLHTSATTTRAALTAAGVL